MYYTLASYSQLLRDKGLLVMEQLFTSGETEITGLTFNSREVTPGTLFICKGAAFKPEYLADAASRGAAAYVSHELYPEIDLPVLLVSDIRKAMPYLASAFFEAPEKHFRLTGLTGTKGKSTTAYYIKAILDDYLAAKPDECTAFMGNDRPERIPAETGVISSIDTYDGKQLYESHITTPESVELFSHFRNAADAGLPYVTMEVSSQALKYDRVGEIRFDVGVFMNISEDHISPQEHYSFADYFTSKLAIFRQTDTAVICTDSACFDQIAQAAKEAKNIVTFGTKEGSDILGCDIRKEAHEIRFRARCDRFDEEFAITMPGLFNVENALAAIAVCYVYDIPVEYIRSGLYRARSKGRMECYTSSDGRIVAIVDYAHNRLSFEKLFASTKEEYPGYDIFTVFGCPGKKALLRRKDLGTIAGQESRKVYLTAEDPGEEPVDVISKDIAQYVACPYEMIEDRGEAIKKAIADCEGPTVLLITGKGEETRQKYGREYIDCPSDAEYVQRYLK